MVDPATARRWSYRTAFAGLALILSLVAILPVELWPATLPGPDLVTCLAFAWVVRRPDFVPPLLVGAVILAVDLLTMRPPGLWAALVVLGVELLRRRTDYAQDPPFLTEWSMFALILVGLSILYWGALTLTLLPPPSARLPAAQVVMTILAYPLAVAFSRQVLNVHRPRGPDPDTFGRRS